MTLAFLVRFRFPYQNAYTLMFKTNVLNVQSDKLTSTERPRISNQEDCLISNPLKVIRKDF
jgi:hypothetical protein